jgi:transposase-like protein
MPPDFAIPDNNSDNNLPNLNNILLQDEIDYLLSHFETHRKSLRCPNCEKKGVFRRNGSTKSESPQPIFRCSNFRVKITLNIVNSMQSTPTNTQTSMNPEFSGSFQGAISSEVA